jgi:hypothetical protein
MDVLWSYVELSLILLWHQVLDGQQLLLWYVQAGTSLSQADAKKL